MVLTLAAVWTVVRLDLVHDDGDPAAACTPATVRVAVAPALRRVAAVAAAELTDRCRTLQVSPRTTADVVTSVQGGEALPDIWIPDSGWPLTALADSGVETEVVAEAVASTPVILVGGAAAAAPASWGEALASGRVALPDPTVETVGAMVLAAAPVEALAAGSSATEASQRVAPVAQAYGERRANGVTEDLDLASLTAASARLVPATEQAYLAARRDNDRLQAVVPATGALLMTFPVVIRADPAAAVEDAAADVVAWFAGEDAEGALAEARLRPADGTTVRPGGAGTVSFLDLPDGETVTEQLQRWQVLSVPSSVLAVIDVSGSMDFVAGESTRIQLAAGVAQTALTIFPDHARVGLWAFSIDQGGPGQDWRELEPVRRLDEVVDGTTQRDLLAGWSQQLVGLTSGGTGLYDTALAAYRRAIADYDEAYSNSVILLTDGANDDEVTIDLRTLLRSLRATADPQRPVRIIGLAISQDADYVSLRKICRATGGRAYLAEDPADVADVFAEAIAGR